MTPSILAGGDARARSVLPGPVRAGAAVLLGLYVAAVLLALRNGVWLVAPHGAPGRYDFAEFWGAGRMVVEGRPLQAYDWRSLAAELQAQGSGVFRKVIFPFFYPPPVLLALVPLGRLPFAAAVAAWSTAALAAYVAGVRACVADGGARLALLATPAAFLCFAVGQTGLFTAAAAAGALVLLDRRPVVAGVLLALLAMKPQVALLFPVALVCTGRWRALVACAVALAVLAALSAAAFGVDAWPLWLHALHPGPGAPAPLAGLKPDKLQSVYGLLVVLGLGKSAAMAGQGASALAAAAWTVWLWRGAGSPSLKAAGLCAAALLVSPYSAIYDLPITAVATGFLMTDAGRRPLGWVEGAALAVACLLPLLFMFVTFPYGPVVCAILCATASARRRLARAPVAILARGPAPAPTPA